jgi:RNA polymerase sigma-70 factor (ECF subfamily)
MENQESSPTSPTLLRLLRSPVTEAAAWEKFLERYRPLIRGWCRRAGLQPTDVEEMEARVLARLVPALRELEYDPACSFRGYLRTVVNNDLRNLWRERAHQPGAQGSASDAVQARLEQVESPYPFDGLADAIDESFHQDLRITNQIAARVKERLEDHVWQAYWLTAIEGRPASEVARQLNMTAAYVYVVRGRVARMLREEAARWDADQDS